MQQNSPEVASEQAVAGAVATRSETVHEQLHEVLGSGARAFRRLPFGCFDPGERFLTRGAHGRRGA